MEPNAAWMRRHERCTFEWIGGQGCGTKLRPSNDIPLTSEHKFGFYDIQGMDHRFGSMEMIEGCLRHDCVLKVPATMRVLPGQHMFAIDDTTVGIHPNAHFVGAAVERDGEHVVVARGGCKFTFKVGPELSLDALPQMEKPETKSERLTWLELPPDPTPPIGEDIATAPLGDAIYPWLKELPGFRSWMRAAKEVPGTLDYFMNHGCDPAALPAKVSPETALDLIAERMGLRRLPAMPTIHGPLTEAEIYAAQLANDAEREAPAPFPEWSRSPRSQSQAIGAGLGVWGTREPPAQREAKPYPHVSEEDLLPDAGR